MAAQELCLQRHNGAMCTLKDIQGIMSLRLFAKPIFTARGVAGRIRTKRVRSSPHRRVGGDHAHIAIYIFAAH